MVATTPGTTPSLLVPPRQPRPVSRFHLYAGLAATTVATLAYVVFLSVRTLPPAGLAVVLFGAAPLCGLLALPVLLSRARAEADAAIQWFGLGLGLAVLAMVLQLVSFPAAMGGHGPLGTDDQGSALLYLLFHVALIVGAAGAALRLDVRWCRVFVVVGALLILATAVNLIPTPQLITPDQGFTPTLTKIQTAVAVGLAVALIGWLMRAGPTPTPLRGWVGVSLLLLTYEVILNAVSDRRFDAVWWSSLTMRAAAFVVLGAGVTLAVTQQLRRFEGYSERELTRREAELGQSIAVGDQMLAVASRLAAVLQPQEVAAVLAEAVRAAVGVEQVQVFDLHPEGRGLRELYRIGDELPEEPTVHSVAEMTMTGSPILLPDDSRNRNHSAIRRRLGAVGERYPTIVCLPLRVAGKSIGALVAVGANEQTWTGWTRDLVLGLGTQTGPALSRARLYEREHAAAEALQLALLPERLPYLPGVQLSGRYVAGRQGLRVGGDWYDCIELPDGRFSLIVGDVMGQGIPAATLMGRLRDSTRILVSVDPSPAAVLDGLNEIVLSAATDQIATVAYALVDPAALKVTIGLAGHLPPVLVPHGAAAQTIGLAGSSPLLGLETRHRPEATVALEAGCALILFTDGLVEDRTGVADGVTRLLSEATELAASGTDCERLASALLKIGQSGEQADDIALLVARLLPAGHEPTRPQTIP